MTKNDVSVLPSFVEDSSENIIMSSVPLTFLEIHLTYLSCQVVDVDVDDDGNGGHDNDDGGENDQDGGMFFHDFSRSCIYNGGL
jgi:hypothetical protein